MWNPTPSSASSSQSSSDNKSRTKEVDVEDCKCSGEQQQLTLDPQLQQHSARNNSKHQQTSTFGGQLTSSTASNQQYQQHNKQQQQQQGEIPSTIGGAQQLDDEESDNNKTFLESTEETSDSGFISGPQPSSSSNIFPDTTKAEGSFGGGLAHNNLNIIGSALDHQQQQKLQEYEIPNLDSGCIDEVDDDGDDDYSATEPPINDQMLLKNNVDAGMSEWFCNLSLQNNATGGNVTATTSSQQQQRTAPQSMSVAGTGINNLDAPKTRPTQASNRLTTLSSSTSLPTSNQQQQYAAGSSATNNAQPTHTATVPQHITPANAWEHYYMQNDDGDTPLHLACISGYVDVVAALIRMAPHPCLFNIQNDEAQTPLHLATLTAQPKIIRMLLIAGAEPTVRDRHGNTALHLACVSGEGQCVRALTIPISASEVQEAHRQYGHRSNNKSYVKSAVLPSDLEIRNYDGERCVHLAAQAGHIDILRILVLYGADINAREGKSGRTPLHIAIECCNEDLANFLLDDCQKLNLETATYAGLTAYQVACILNKSEMQDILEKRGAEPLTPPDSDYDSDIETDLDDSKLYDRFGDPGYFVGYKGGNIMTVA